ncbi:MAG: DEAD/DEAH box helicase, partial [Solirubrobacterales bacterium]|nr:DEAD/DEAH box helicase [Solirubrobacterales bacterium]
MSSFADLGVSRPVVGALTKRGITAPFAVQKLVIEDVLDGRDVLVQSPTGSGKTLAFGLPLVDCIEASDRRPAALILAPTRELALQIVAELHDIATARALSVAPVYGGVGLERQAKRAARAHIVVATPGRLEDLLQRGAFTLDHVRVLVIDEADRMLDMGFKPAVDRIVARTPSDRQTLFFSATLEAAAGKVARAYTRDASRHVHEPVREDAGEVEHRFVHLEHSDKVGALVDELRATERGRTLVFVRTKRGADRLVKRLNQRGVEAVAMHGDKSQNQRQRALASFSNGRIDTLVATDVAARGIDVEDITHVINFDAPPDRDSYVHRVGRSGRAGRDGAGVSFVLPDQSHEMGTIAASLGLRAEFEHTRPQGGHGRPSSQGAHAAPAGHASARPQRGGGRRRRRRGRAGSDRRGSRGRPAGQRGARCGDRCRGRRRGGGRPA